MKWLVAAAVSLFLANPLTIAAKEEAVASDIHGVLDISFKNDYITPRGLLVSNTRLTVQVLSILLFDIYHNPNGWVNKATVYTGAWNDIWTAQHSPTVGAWNELDWFIGVNFNFAQNWKFSVQFYPFLSPPGHFKEEDNIEFLLAYDDSQWGCPITLNPYIKWFWTVAGDSTVVVGKRGGTYDVEIGLIPTLDLSKYNCSLPITFTAPTWITVGPASFWNGGDLGLKNVKTHFGVFTSGLRGDIPLKSIPARLGKWHVYAGVQYYNLINKNLLQAQTVTLSLSSIKSAHRNVWVPSAGIGLSY